MTFIIGTPHARNAGYLTCETGGHNSKHIEDDLRTCTHCQRVILLSKWKEEGAWCSRCSAPVCAIGPCAERTEKYGCLPWIKHLEQYFECQGKLQQFRKLVGLDP